MITNVTLPHTQSHSVRFGITSKRLEEVMETLGLRYNISLKTSEEQLCTAFLQQPREQFTFYKILVGQDPDPYQARHIYGKGETPTQAIRDLSKLILPGSRLFSWFGPKVVRNDLLRDIPEFKPEDPKQIWHFIK